jgi:hypothetical protein
MTTLRRRFSGTTGDVATVGTREEHHEGHGSGVSVWGLFGMCAISSDNNGYDP